MLDKIDPALVERRSRELIADEGFKQILAVAKQSAIRDWAAATPEEKDTRENSYWLLQGIGRLEQVIQGLTDKAMMRERKEAKAKA